MKSHAPELVLRIGQEIRERRKLLGVSQEAFADRIRMHRAYYGALERGEKNLQLSTLERVCAGLGVGVSTLIERAEHAAARSTAGLEGAAERHHPIR